MKQILQNLASGETSVVEVPSLPVRPGHLRIKTTVSLISAGTERMLVDFRRANYLEKARQQPEKVAQVVRKVRTDGLVATYGTVRARLDEPQPLGYSNVGTVVEIGEGFEVGDRVVSNGRHAEIVVVPRNLCARIPESVTDHEAAFTVVSSIGLQGVRLAEPTLGESFVVYGLGLIGLLTAQILKANGCRVLGLDVSKKRVAIAEGLGIEAADVSSGADPVAHAMKLSAGIGVDGVIITASTKSDALISDSANMCRKRGRIVLIGVTGLDLNRSDFYEKELSFQVSCSYGPGRYDPLYEDHGQDYPLPFVRWTEQRNFAAVLDMLAQKTLRTDGLVSAVLPLADAGDAYARIVEGDVITVILQYPEATAQDERTIAHREAPAARVPGGGAPRVAVIGAGNFTKARLGPALQRSGAALETIVSARGLTSASAAKKFGFRYNSNDVDAVWTNPDIDTVFVTTRHDTHGGLVLKSLEVGKNVFVEKPLTIREEELEQIVGRVDEIAKSGAEVPRVMVGFNRRFAPLVRSMKDSLTGRTQPITAVYTANAGEIPADHWTQDMDQGGGRILGEACHFVDLLAFLAASPIAAVTATQIGRESGAEITEDKMTIVLEFVDGSHGTVHYFANGARDFPKERVEVFSEGRILQLDNFRKLRSFGFGRNRGFGMPTPGGLFKGQDKGHSAGFLAFVESVRSGEPSPIPFEQIVNTTQACFAAVRSARTGERIEL